MASESETIEEARENLVEALTLFFECAGPVQLERRFKPEVLLTQVEVEAAKRRTLSGGKQPARSSNGTDSKDCANAAVTS